MRVPKISLSIAAFIILVFGCHRAAIAYRLRHDGVLLPPTAADNTSQTVSIAIKRARHETQKTMDCGISGICCRGTGRGRWQRSHSTRNLFLRHPMIRAMQGGGCMLIRSSQYANSARSWLSVGQTGA